MGDAHGPSSLPPEPTVVRAPGPDAPRLRIKERAVLRKFEGDIQTDEHLLEVIVAEDGVITEHWRRGDGTAPPDG